MKRLVFNLAHDLGRIHEELIAAIPSLERVRIRDEERFLGDRESLPDNIRAEGLGDKLTITVADDADEVAIQAVIDAHDATPRAVVPTRQEELLAVGKDNWTDAQQKELIELLAKNDG